MSSLLQRAGAETRTPAPRAAAIAALDIGASKISCFIGGASQGPGPLRVAGVGSQTSRGVRNGVIVDLDRAHEAVRAAVHQAERMAGVAVSEVVVSVSGFGVRAERARGEIGVHGGEIGIKEKRRVVGAAMQQVRLDNRHILHATPVGFTVDGERVRDPRGMLGRRLGVAITVVTVPAPQWRNLVLCVERAVLTVSGAVASPYAAALASLAEEEMEAGVLLVDMGARATTAAVIHQGALMHVDAVPIGSDHVTQDVAQCFQTTPAVAERLKVMHGSAIASLHEDNQMIDAPHYCEDGGMVTSQIARSMLTGIVRPRVEETLELLRDRLAGAGLEPAGGGRRIVLTGGGAKLVGVRELAARVFGGHVRVGRPQRFAGLGDAVSGPAYAVPAGLLRWGIEQPSDLAAAARAGADASAHPLARAVAWVRDNIW